MTTISLPAPAPGTLTAGTILLVANPAAAQVTESLVAAIAHRVAPCCTGLATVWTSAAGHARDLAAAAVLAEGVTLVVAIGGDGTVREVADGLIRGTGPAFARRHDSAPPALLALPAGSGNSTCRNVWGERDWSEVLDLVTCGETRVRHVDLMRLAETNSTVLLGASSGFLAQVLIAAKDVVGFTGRDRYYAAAAGVLEQMPAHATRVVVDGVTVHDGIASLVAVGGGRYRAHDFQFLPASELDDGLLDVCVIAQLEGVAVGEVAALVVAGAHTSRPEVRTARGRHVTIERTDGRPLVAESDGDVWDDAGTTMTLAVVPGALPMLAPVRPVAG